MKRIKQAFTFMVFMFVLVGVAQTLPVQIFCSKSGSSLWDASIFDIFDLFTSSTSKVAINGRVVGRCFAFHELVRENKGIIRLKPGSYTVTVSDTLPMGSSVSGRGVFQVPQNWLYDRFPVYVVVEFNYSAAYLFYLGSKATNLSSKQKYYRDALSKVRANDPLRQKVLDALEKVEWEMYKRGLITSSSPRIGLTI